MLTSQFLQKVIIRKEHSKIKSNLIQFASSENRDILIKNQKKKRVKSARKPDILAEKQKIKFKRLSNEPSMSISQKIDTNKVQNVDQIKHSRSHIKLGKREDGEKLINQNQIEMLKQGLEKSSKFLKHTSSPVDDFLKRIESKDEVC